MLGTTTTNVNKYKNSQIIASTISTAKNNGQRIQRSINESSKPHCVIRHLLNITDMSVLCH